MNKFLTKHTNFILWFLIALVTVHILILWPIKSNLSSVYNAVNSIAPLIAIILIYITFNEQRKQVKDTEKQLDLAKKDSERNAKTDILNRIDQHFILSLGIHRDNVTAMNFDGKIIGKEFFVEVFNRFEEIYNQLYIKYFVEINKYLIRDLKKNELIDISYKILFYGIGSHIPNETLDHNFKSYDYLLKPHSENETGFGCFIYSFWTYQIGMQSNLSHYFRHLYHTVTYIHDLNIDPDEKLFYIKEIRGQFSNHEQAIFFINTLSIGSNWRRYRKNADSDPVDLVTKYELIKNLPGNFFEHVNHKCYYTKIRYEEDNGIAFEKTIKGEHCHEKFPD